MTPFSSLPFTLRTKSMAMISNNDINPNDNNVNEHKQYSMNTGVTALLVSKPYTTDNVKTELLPSLYSDMLPKQTEKGAVYLVGAGSGDPELLTLKAYRVMQQAEVVLYDSLVSEDILDMCAAGARKIFVGKRRDNHAMPQQDINQLLVKHAKAGRCVVRLKGGDPFIFGRGGEELQTVVQHGIYFESIPGITAASAASSSTAIPLTHRDCAQSVKFITAYKRSHSPNEDFKEMLDPTQTVVLYMGLHRLPSLTEGLIEAGRAPSTPFAIISHASLPTQKTLIGTLESIVAQQAVAKLPTPALLVMGDVVKLHAQLSPYNLSDPRNSNIKNHMIDRNKIDSIANTLNNKDVTEDKQRLQSVVELLEQAG